MTIKSLYAKCSQFAKLAQQSPDVAKKQQQYNSGLKETLLNIGRFLTGKNAAEAIFNNIKEYKANPNYIADTYYKAIQKYFTLLEFYENLKIKNNLKPLQGLNSNAVPVILNNLKILLEGKDFSKYQHYSLMQYGEPKSVNIDEWAAEEKKKDQSGY